MTCDWSKSTLGDVMVLQRGHDLPSQDRCEGPYPVVGSTGIVGTHDKYKYDPPGVLVGRSGVIGGAILIGQPYWPLNTTLFVKDFRGNEPRWIYYLLKTIDFSGFDSGSAQPSLNRNYIAGISVLLPPLAEQRGIAATLGALDDKIESNRRITSQAWTLVECKYRSITSSAKARTLGDLMSLEYGKALPAATRSPGTVPVYGSSGITGYHSKSLIPGPAVIVGRKGSIGTVHWSADSCYPIDTTFYVRPNVAVSLLACYFALKSLDLSAMNSDSAVPGLNRHATLAQYINFADYGLLVKWAQESMPMVNRAITTDRESGLLSSLRDALAPELLSGRIRVPEAQEAVEAVI